MGTFTRASVAIALALLATLSAATAHAGKKDDFAGGAVVFARDHALWRTDPQGKDTPTELATLPDGGRAADVRTIRSDATGAIILVDLAGTWYWLRSDASAGAAATATRLPCATDARVTADGKSVVCADAAGDAIVYSFRTGKRARRKVPGAGARVIPAPAGSTRGRELVWADADGVWAAPLDAPTERRALAPDAPLRGFSASPDASRALGVYLTTAWQKRSAVEAEGLMTFALDGKGARRKSIRDGVVIDWSWDGVWLLVQDGDRACVARAVGGEYKCWTGYTASSLSPDGRWALLLGARKATDAKDKDKDAEPAPDAATESAEGADADAPADAPADEAATGPRSLYRARLEGAYTDRPSLVETIIDGAGALWLPAAR